MSTNVFVSYNFKRDRELARNLKPFFAPAGPCHGAPKYVERDVSGDGESAIKEEILSVMDDCEAAIFVYGDDTHNSPWINKEAQFATSKNLPIVALRVKGSTGNIPNELTSGGREIPRAEWDPADLAAKLNPLLSHRTPRR